MSAGRKLIRFRVENGKVTVAPEGFTGSECMAATRPYEHALGIMDAEEVGARHILPSYYQTESKVHEEQV